MEVFPHDIEIKLEVDQIRDAIRRHCQSEAGRLQLDQVEVIDDPDQLTQDLALTADIIRLNQQESEKPAFQFEEISDVLARVQVEGTYLAPEDFVALRVSLEPCTVGRNS